MKCWCSLLCKSYLFPLLTQVPFQIPFEVNVVLVGFNADGGYRYSLDVHKLGTILKEVFPTHRPTCLETAQQLDIEHNLYYSVLPVSAQKSVFFESYSWTQT